MCIRDRPYGQSFASEDMPPADFNPPAVWNLHQSRLTTIKLDPALGPRLVPPAMPEPMAPSTRPQRERSVARVLGALAAAMALVVVSSVLAPRVFGPKAAQVRVVGVPHSTLERTLRGAERVDEAQRALLSEATTGMIARLPPDKGAALVAQLGDVAAGSRTEGALALLFEIRRAEVTRRRAVLGEADALYSVILEARTADLSELPAAQDLLALVERDLSLWPAEDAASVRRVIQDLRQARGWRIDEVELLLTQFEARMVTLWQ